MIETRQTVAIDADIDSVWAFARDIRRWAALMPGMQDCTVVDDDNSHWALKVGVGGLVRTVRVQVHVDRWDGPERVAFSFKLQGDPVKGGGAYFAARKGPLQTEVTLDVRVEGGGPMAPMWEAMGRPLLPQLARAFADQLKAEIERDAAAASQAPAEAKAPSLFQRLAAWLRAILTQTRKRQTGGTGMSQQNKDLVRRFIEGFSRGDVETAKACLAPDAITYAKGFGKLSGPRPYDFIVATTGAFKDLIPTGLRPQFKTVTAEGDRVVVEFEGDATLVNGERYCNQYCMVFTVREDRIKQVNEYYCTILADEKIGPLLADVEAQRKSAGA